MNCDLCPEGERLAKGESCRAIAKTFGCHHATVARRARS
jgi:transposase